ncbi:MAG: matrixin family metalloprotease [Candidatus Melainabacteria bacterium]|nr:matrixin family metalloprotease [Candidatus Melainabacteria bacterium]
MRILETFINNKFQRKAFIITMLVAYSSQTNSIAADSQRDGFEYVKNKNFLKALDCFTAALKEHPNSWAIMQSVGSCHLELGQYDRAIAILQKSIEVGGLHASQCKNMAAVYQRLGQPKKALSWLKLACSVDPTQAADPNVQAAISKLQDPANNPSGSLTASDYLSSLVSFKGWRKESMPLKVHVRKNIQIPGFYDEFLSLIRESFDQWAVATGGAVSYRFVESPDGANVLCDYTDRRELVSSQHELGIDGITEMLVKRDNTPGSANIIVLVKDGPGARTFKQGPLLRLSCLHEVGHTLGMHGHSPNNHDVMFSAATFGGASSLTERDKSTIRKIYQR